MGINWQVMNRRSHNITEPTQYLSPPVNHGTPDESSPRQHISSAHSHISGVMPYESDSSALNLTLNTQEDFNRTPSPSATKNAEKFGHGISDK